MDFLESLGPKLFEGILSSIMPSQPMKTEDLPKDEHNQPIFPQGILLGYASNGLPVIMRSNLGEVENKDEFFAPFHSEFVDHFRHIEVPHENIASQLELLIGELIGSVLVIGGTRRRTRRQAIYEAAAREIDPETGLPVKRGPGRPRVRPLPDPNAPKRPRGRPRKGQ